MKAGDLVWIYSTSHWGGRRLICQNPGTLIRRTYLAYDSRDTRWEVLVGGETRKYRERALSLVKEEGKGL